jgi:hypothetical protein
VVELAEDVPGIAVEQQGGHRVGRQLAMDTSRRSPRPRSSGPEARVALKVPLSPGTAEKAALSVTAPEKPAVPGLAATSSSSALKA